MSAPAKVTSSVRRPIAPTVEAWRAMAPAERQRFLEDVLEALSDSRDVMFEARANEAETRAKQAETRAGDAVFALQRSVLRVLEARRIEVPDDLRATVVACQDVEVLERWLARAVTAARAADVAQEDVQTDLGR